MGDHPPFGKKATTRPKKSVNFEYEIMEISFTLLKFDCEKA
jgi:hypothetical protein